MISTPTSSAASVHRLILSALPCVCDVGRLLGIGQHRTEVNDQSCITYEFTIMVLKLATVLINTLGTIKRSRAFRSWWKILPGHISANPTWINGKPFRQFAVCSQLLPMRAIDVVHGIPRKQSHPFGPRRKIAAVLDADENSM
jgi:hypothetical protein